MCGNKAGVPMTRQVQPGPPPLLFVAAHLVDDANQKTLSISTDLSIHGISAALVSNPFCAVSGDGGYANRQ
jgi:hypothetical protein